MIDVDIASFETEVVQASSQVPVLIDFWAPWCGPCKTIGPMLEQLEAQYAGRFKLVKINSDEEQQLSAAFGVRSIPTCILMINGQPVDGFMGALPLGQIQGFLDKHLPPSEPQEAEPGDDASPLQEADRLAALLTSVDQSPDDDNVRFECAQAHLLQGDLQTVSRLLQPFPDKPITDRRLESVSLILEAGRQGSRDTPLSAARMQHEAAVALNKRDFPARYRFAQALIAQAQYASAMDELLEILMRDKLWDKETGQEGKARRLYVAILDLIDLPKTKTAEGQIPTEDATVSSYRRRLSSVVLS